MWPRGWGYTHTLTHSLIHFSSQPTSCPSTRTDPWKLQKAFLKVIGTTQGIKQGGSKEPAASLRSP